MPSFHGEIGDGKFGVMNSEQVQEMVINKAGLQPSKEWKSNCTTAINKILSERGTPCGAYKYQNLTVYHASSGVGAQAGCTLFYVLRPGDIVKLVGVGYHVGAQTYQIDWKEAGWCGANKITLDK